MTTRIKNEDLFHLLTGRTPLGINRVFSHQLKKAEISLTKEQWSVMAVLWKEDGVTQQFLADATFRDRAGITRLLDNLERDRLVERRPHEEDRRTNLIFLTKKGKEIEEDVVNVLEETIHSVTENIDDDSIENLRFVFEKINDNIQKLENQEL